MKKICALLLAVMMIFGLLGTGCSSSKTPEPAAKYPEKDITITVPYAAGSGIDLMSRAHAKFIAQKTGVTVLVVNKPGGGGSTAIAEVAKKAPDGYNIAVMTNGSYLINPLINNVGFEANSMTPLGIQTELPVVFGVNADSQFKTLDDLLDYAQKNPGKLRYVSAGLNSSPYFAVEQIASLKGRDIKFTHVPNVTGAEGITMVLGNQVEMTSINGPTLKPYYDAKTMRILAITGNERSKDFPDVPTFKELGYDEIDAFKVYFGYVGPKGLPDEVVTTLDGLFKEASTDPATMAEIQKTNNVVYYEDYKAFAKRLDADVLTYKAIIDKLAAKK